MKYLYCIWCAIALLCNSLESYRIFQNASYRPQRGYYKVLFTWYYLILLLLAAFSWLCYEFFYMEVIICGVYTLVSIPLVFVRRKTPLQFTKRIVRMMCAEFLLLLVGCYFALHWWAPFLPLFVLLSWLLCLPIDCLINRKYFRSASEKLKATGVAVIAITGSYGKTSTKDMLCALLENSIAPKGSCNTPLGIAKFINSTDLSSAKYLILEFGARKKGDIAELCKLYMPKYGIVTGICEQHLSTFKSLENILSTKGELVESIPENSFCILGDSASDLRELGSCAKIEACVSVSDCSVSVSGLEFVASCDGESAKVSLPQITLHSTETFAICATMCMKLGQSLKQSVQNCRRIKQTPHRMEISHNGAFYIIDDSYNASIKGVESCVNVLKMLSGTKVVISQGIVEGGKRVKELNYHCGELLGSVCNVFIVLGKNSVNLKAGGQTVCDTVLTAKNLQNAVSIAQRYMQRDGFLIFQNDLPDVVNI